MSSRHCEQRDEYVDVSECDEMCEDEECQHSFVFKQNAFKLKDMELGKMVMAKLKGTFGVDEEMAEKLTTSLCDSVISYTTRDILKIIKIAVERQAWKYVTTITKEWLRQQVEHAIKEEIVILDNSGAKDKINRNTIQDIVLKEYKRVIQGDSRYSAQSALDDIIKGEAKRQVTETVEELKAETIEKFNKEMMKKMMQGMAGAIADDKRLLALLDT